jgi:4-amino-4-deoxy-L-arabinose transferase-like glycosyltransferase
VLAVGSPQGTASPDSAAAPTAPGPETSGADLDRGVELDRGADLDRGEISRGGRGPLLLLVAIMVAAFGLNAWALSTNGLGNTFYSAGSRAMSESWKNFFFNAFDPGGYITVDKPPVAMWFEALSVRVFGFSTWSLLLPSAVFGAGSVGMLWVIVRRWFGVTAAAIAALVLALSPINVAVNRLNLPEPFMIFFLLVAVWTCLRSLDSQRWWWWLMASGVLIGIAFNTKMLAAFIPGPAFVVAIAIGSRCRWRQRVGRLAVFGLAALVVSASWLVVVDLTPASARPYVGGSTDNTVWDLIVGYNGLGRVDGNGQGGGAGGGGAFGGIGGVFGGAPGWGRLFNDAVGAQIAWLLPLAALGAAVALWTWRRDSRRLAAVVLWGGWFALYGVVFSLAEGTFHSYYTSAMAPAVGALIGIGGVALISQARRSPAWLAVAGVGVVGTAALQLELIDRTPDFQAWTKPLVIGLVLAAVVGLAVAAARRRWSWVLGALAVALVGLLVTPAAWAANETTAGPLNATLPQAGPREGTAGRTFGSAGYAGTDGLADFLRGANTDGETWDLVTVSSMQASDLIAADDLSVMALGGFMGSDPAATVASTADRVAAGEVRYFLVSQGGGAGGFGGTGGFGPQGNGGGQFSPPNGRSGGRGQFTPPNGGQFPGGGQLPNGGQLPGGGQFPGGQGGAGGMGAGNTANQIMSAVRSACTPLTNASTGGALPSAYDGQVYDCAGQADALRAAG